MNRSQIALARGDLSGVWITLMPLCLASWANNGPNLLSRSRMRYFGRWPQSNGFPTETGFLFFAAGFMPPVKPKQLAMPAQQGFRLYQQKGLIPESGQAGQEHQSPAVTRGEMGAFDLPIKDDELLAQQCVFNEQIGAVAGQVGGCSDDEGGGCRFGPATDNLTDLIKKPRPETRQDADHFILRGSRENHHRMIARLSEMRIQNPTDEQSSQMG